MALICRICIKIVGPANEPAEPLSKYKDFGWNLITGQILACFPDLDLRIFVRNPLIVCAKCAHIVREFSSLRMRVQETEKLLLQYVDFERQCDEESPKPKIGRSRGVDLAAVASMYESAANLLLLQVKLDRFVRSEETGKVAVVNYQKEIFCTTPLSTKHDSNVPSIDKNNSNKDEFCQPENLSLQLGIAPSQIDVTNDEIETCIEHIAQSSEADSVASNVTHVPSSERYIANQIQANSLDCVRDIEGTITSEKLEMSPRIEIYDAKLLDTQKSVESLGIFEDNIPQPVEVISGSIIRKSTRRIAIIQELKAIEESFKSTSTIDVNKSSDNNPPKPKAIKRNIAKSAMESVSNIEWFAQSQSNTDQSLKPIDLSVKPGPRPKKGKFVEPDASSTILTVAAQTIHWEISDHKLHETGTESINQKLVESMSGNGNCSEETSNAELTNEKCMVPSTELSIIDVSEQNNQSTPEENLELPTSKRSNVEQQQPIINDSLKLDSSSDLLEIYKVIPYEEPKKIRKKKLRGKRFLFNIPKKRQRKMPFITSVVSLSSTQTFSENVDFASVQKLKRVKETQNSEQKLKDEKCTSNIQEEDLSTSKKDADTKSQGFGECLNESVKTSAGTPIEVSNFEPIATRNMVRVRKNRVCEEVPSNQQDHLKQECLTQVLTSEIENSAIVNLKQSSTEPHIKVISGEASAFQVATSEDLDTTLTSADEFHNDSLQSKIPPKMELYSATPNITDSSRCQTTRYGRKIKATESYFSFARKRRLRAKVNVSANHTLSPEGLSLPVSISFEGQMVFLKGLKLKLVSPDGSTVSNDNSITMNETLTGDVTSISDTTADVNMELNLIATSPLTDIPTSYFDESITEDDSKTYNKNHSMTVADVSVIEDTLNPTIAEGSSNSKNVKSKSYTTRRWSPSRTTKIHSLVEEPAQINEKEIVDGKLSTKISHTKSDVTLRNTSLIDASSTILPVLNLNQAITEDESNSRSVSVQLKTPLDINTSSAIISTAATFELECPVLISNPTMTEANNKTRNVRGKAVVPLDFNKEATNITEVPLSRIKTKSDVAPSTAINTCNAEIPVLTSEREDKEDNSKPKMKKTHSLVSTDEGWDAHSTTGSISITKVSVTTPEQVEEDNTKLRMVQAKLGDSLDVSLDTSSTAITTSTAHTPVIPLKQIAIEYGHRKRKTKVKSSVFADFITDVTSIVSHSSITELSTPTTEAAIKDHLNLVQTEINRDTSKGRKIKVKSLDINQDIPFTCVNTASTFIDKALTSTLKQTQTNEEAIKDDVNLVQTKVNRDTSKERKIKVKSGVSLDINQDIPFTSVNTANTFIDKVSTCTLQQTTKDNSPKAKGVKVKSKASPDVNKDVPPTIVSTAITEVSNPYLERTVVKRDTSKRRKVKGKKNVNTCTDVTIPLNEQKDNSKAKRVKAKFTVSSNVNKDVSLEAATTSMVGVQNSILEQAVEEKNCKTKRVKAGSFSSLLLNKDEQLNLRGSSKTEDLASIHKLTITVDNSKTRRIKRKSVISFDISKDVPPIDASTLVNKVPTTTNEHTNEETIKITPELIPRLEFKKDISQNTTTRLFIQDQSPIIDPALEKDNSSSLEAKSLRMKNPSSTMKSAGTIIIPVLTSEQVVKETQIRTAKTSSRKTMCAKTVKTLTTPINDTLFGNDIYEAENSNTKACTFVDVSKDPIIPIIEIPDLTIDQPIAGNIKTRKANKKIDTSIDNVTYPSTIKTTAVKNSKAKPGKVKNQPIISTSSIADFPVVLIDSAVKTESSQILLPPLISTLQDILPKTSESQTLIAISKDPTNKQFMYSNETSPPTLHKLNETIESDKFNKVMHIKEIFIIISAEDQSLARAQLTSPSKEGVLQTSGLKKTEHSEESKEDQQKALANCNLSASLNKSKEDVNENLISDLEEFKRELIGSTKDTPKCITSERGISFQKGIDGIIKLPSTSKGTVREHEHSSSIFLEDISNDTSDLIKIKHDYSKKSQRQSIDTSTQMVTLLREPEMPKIDESNVVLTDNNIDSPVKYSDNNGKEFDKIDSATSSEIISDINKSKELVKNNDEAIISCQSEKIASDICDEKPTELSEVDKPKVIQKSPGRRKNKSPIKCLKSTCKSKELKPDDGKSPVLFAKQEVSPKTIHEITFSNELNTQEHNKETLCKSSLKLDKVINILKSFSSSELKTVKEDYLTPVISCQKRDSFNDTLIQEHNTPTLETFTKLETCDDIKYKLSPKSEKSSTVISSDGKAIELTQDDIESVIFGLVEESSNIISVQETPCANDIPLCGGDSLITDKKSKNKTVASSQDVVISCLESSSSIDSAMIESNNQPTESLNIVESQEACSLDRTSLIFEDPALPAAEIIPEPIDLSIPVVTATASKCLINRKRKTKRSPAKTTDQSAVQNMSKDCFYEPKIKTRKVMVRCNKSKINKSIATQKRINKCSTSRIQPNALAIIPQEAAQSAHAAHVSNLRDCFLECIGKSPIDETPSNRTVVTTADASISQTLKEFWAEFNTSLESPGKSSQDQFIDSMGLPEVFAEVTLPYLDAEADLCVDSSNLEDITPTLITGPKVLTDAYLTMQDHCQENVLVSVPTQFDSDSFQQQVDGLSLEDILRNKIECHPTETTSSDNTVTNTEYISDMLPDNNAIYASTDYLPETDQNLIEPGTSKALPKPIPVLLSISGKSGRQSIKIIKVSNTTNNSNVQEQSSMESCDTFPQPDTPTNIISCEDVSIETPKQAIENNSTVFPLHNTSLSPNSNLMLLVKPGDILESPRNTFINQQPATTCDNKSKSILLSSPSKVLLSPEYKLNDINPPLVLVSFPSTLPQESDCYTATPSNEPEYSNVPLNPTLTNAASLTLPKVQKRRGRPPKKTVRKLVSSSEEIGLATTTSQIAIPHKRKEKTIKKMVPKPLINHEDIRSKMVPKCSNQPVTNTRKHRSKISSSIAKVEPVKDLLTEFSDYLSGNSFSQIPQNPLNDLPGQVVVNPGKPKPLEKFTSVIVKPEPSPYPSVSVESTNIKQIKFSCEICRFDFEIESSLLNHKKWHYKWGGLHQCKYCIERYDDLEELNSHIFIHGAMHQCNNCNQQFGSRESLHDHLLSNHGINYLNDSTMLEPEMLCPDCGRMVTISVLPFHLDWHDPETAIRCAICSSFVLRMDHHMHWNNHHHNNKHFVCAVCGENYSTKQTLCWHLEKHSNKCRLCGIEINKVGLGEHSCPKGNRRLYKRRKHQKMMATFRDRRAFKCKSCPMAYYFRDHLRIHAYRMHKECDQCGQVCFTEIVLQAHKIRVHGIDINAQFALCTRSYKSNKEIIEEAEQEMNRVRTATAGNKTILTTKRTKKITCDICGRVFESYSSLSTHRQFHKRKRHSKANRRHVGHGRKHKNCIQTIDGKKGYVCWVCGRIFESTYSRSSHMASHTGINSSRKRSSYGKLPARSSEPKEQSEQTSIILTQDVSRSKLIIQELSSDNLDTSVLMDNIDETVEKTEKLTGKSTNVAHAPVDNICQICEKRFKTLKQLALHISIHSGIKSFTCTLCDKHFFTSGELQEHALSCHITPRTNPTTETTASQPQSRSPRRTHACHCGEQFLSLATLRKHKALVHPTAPRPLPNDLAPAQ